MTSFVTGSRHCYGALHKETEGLEKLNERIVIATLSDVNSVNVMDKLTNINGFQRHRQNTAKLTSLLRELIEGCLPSTILMCCF